MPVGCLGAVGAATADRYFLCIPLINVAARGAVGRGGYIFGTELTVIVPFVCYIITPTFDTLFTAPLAILRARSETTSHRNTLAQPWATYRIIARGNAHLTASPAVVSIGLKVLASTIASTASWAAQGNHRVSRSTLPLRVVELGAKCPIHIEVLELNSLDLIDGLPRDRNRIRPLLPRGHKWPIRKRTVPREEGPPGDVIKPIRVTHGRGKRNGFTVGDRPHVRREREEEGAPVSGRRCTSIARGADSRRLHRIHGRRSRACRGRSRRHRHERVRRLCRRRIVSSATREPHKTSDQKSSAHAWSLAKRQRSDKRKAGQRRWIDALTPFDRTSTNPPGDRLPALEKFVLAPVPGAHRIAAGTVSPGSFSSTSPCQALSHSPLFTHTLAFVHTSRKCSPPTRAAWP